MLSMTGHLKVNPIVRWQVLRALIAGALLSPSLFVLQLYSADPTTQRAPSLALVIGLTA
jgi:hypothetical protein